jgi:hypothetical protein
MAPAEAAMLGHAMSERRTEREVPIRLPEQGSWKLGDPISPDMIRVRPDPKRKRVSNAEFPDEVVE